MKHILSIFKQLLGWPLSAVAMFLMFKTIFSQKDALILNFESINPAFLFLAFFSYLVYYFLRSYQWKKILQESGHTIPLKEAAYLWSYSELKRFVPGKIWPFLGRTMAFEEKGISKKIIISSLLIEAELLLIGSVLVSLLSIFFVFDNILPKVYNSNLIIFTLILLSLVFSILYAANRFWLKPLEKFFLSKFINHLLPNFSFRANLILIATSVAYMFFFGLGTCLILLAFIKITFHPLILIGFSVFSFLVGYVSFITPMGLGVREGVLTLGLSKLTSITSAAAVSVFSRVVLIISELIFLYFTYLWSKNKKNLFKSLKNFFTLHKFKLLLGVFILIYVVYFTTASFLRFENFYAGRFDLGNMDQTVWNTINGRIFQLTDPDGTETISRLAVHSDFILILLAPFYLFWSDPRMLLLIQTLILASGSIFIYLISQKIIGKKWFSLILSLLFLLNPSLQNTNLYDFHAVTLATTFILAWFYFFIQRKYLLFIFFVILAALTKEQLWFIVSLFGLYIFIDSFQQGVSLSRLTRSILVKQRFLGISMFIISFLIGGFLILFVMPNVRGSNHFALSYYSDFGNSPTSIVKNIIFSPAKTLSLVLEPSRLVYLKQLLLPLSFFSLLSPQILFFAMPDLAINILSNNNNLHEIYYQYTAAITPFLFIAAIYSVKRLKTMFSGIPLFVYVFILISATAYSAYSFGPLPFSKNRNINMLLKPQQDKKIIDQFLDSIPRQYSIASTNNIGSHLSHRQKIFTIPLGIDKADIIVFLLNDITAQPSLAVQKEMAEKMKKDEMYVKVFEKGDFIVFKKNSVEIW